MVEARSLWVAGRLVEPAIDAPVVQVITGTVGIVMTVLTYLLVFVAILLRWTTPRVASTSCSTWAASSCCLSW